MNPIASPADTPLERRNRLVEQVFRLYCNFVRVIIDRRLSPGLRRRVGVTEIAQVVWQKATPRIAEVWASGRTAMSKWIATVAVNAVNDEYRRAANSVTYGAGEIATDPAEATPPRQESWLAVEMAAALERLDPQHRRVLEARHVERLTLQQVADREGVGITKASDLIETAERRLRELMGEAGR
jgi:RNA polymerase sigma factor (sigma-70 family)